MIKMDIESIYKTELFVNAKFMASSIALSNL
jgi:hypothetical protein